jgi:hypothetical protein
VPREGAACRRCRGAGAATPLRRATAGNRRGGTESSFTLDRSTTKAPARGRRRVCPDRPETTGRVPGETRCRGDSGRGRGPTRARTARALRASGLCEAEVRLGTQCSSINNERPPWKPSFSRTARVRASCCARVRRRSTSGGAGLEERPGGRAADRDAAARSDGSSPPPEAGAFFGTGCSTIRRGSC